MTLLRLFFLIAVVALFSSEIEGKDNGVVVVDSLTRAPLSNASVFDNKGHFIGMSRNGGKITCASSSDYPITVRYLGYYEKTIESADIDSVFLRENIAQLPEVVIEGKQKRILHILAYVREHSTLSSYTDTVTMFREKNIDYMLPADSKTKFKGWKYPRVISSSSYYRFTNSDGLDSVSNQCNYHFSWSDWIGVIPQMPIPSNLIASEIASDTVFGKYSPTEVWNRNKDRISVDINVLADTSSQKWVPMISSFFRKEDTEFEQFRLHVNYDNIPGNEVTPLDLTGFSFNIDSRGRGHGMFMFNKYDQPFFVTTYTEVYILDKEYITVKEARKWHERKFKSEDIPILEPTEAPELQPSTLALIDRVNNVNTDIVRLSVEPDQRLVSPYVSKTSDNIGKRMLTLLKQLTGISSYQSRRNLNRRLNDFHKSYRKQNRHDDQ